MLSGDLANKIGGRYKEIYVQALSYEEFMAFHELPDSDDTLAKYIQFGGLPGLKKIGLDEQDAREYQTDVYSTVLLKDVIKRNNIRNVPFLENLIHFLADNTGKISSANSIAKYMRSQGESITSTAIINYAKYLCDSYMIHKVNRYDIHGRKIFESNDKFYFEDNGIRNTLVGGSREKDIEKVIENISEDFVNDLTRSRRKKMSFGKRKPRLKRCGNSLANLRISTGFLRRREIILRMQKTDCHKSLRALQ